MLDDFNVISQRDPYHLLEAIAAAPEILTKSLEIQNPEFDQREIASVVFIGIGEALTGAEIVTQALDKSLAVPIIYSDGSHIPEFTSANTLAILSGQGNSPQLLASCYAELRTRNCQIAILAPDNELLARAARDHVIAIELQDTGELCTSSLQHLVAIVKIFEHFKLINSEYSTRLASTAQWLSNEADAWHFRTPIHENFAKQIALVAAGKSAIFYGGPHGALLARYFRQAWQVIAKNLAFSGQYPSFVNEELASWSSHPVDKPYFTADIISDFDDVEVASMMILSDRLLSGLRPQTLNVHTDGDDFLAEAAWSIILANYAATYLAILNNSRPSDRRLVEKYHDALEN